MRKEVKILGAIGIFVIIIAAIASSYYKNSAPPKRITNINDKNSTAAITEALVRPDSPTLGADDAKVTIVEFLDPECEACAAFYPSVKKVLKDYEGKTRLVVRYMPLHPNSYTAATFLEAAREQGKYWQAQELLFQKQPEWGTKHGAPTGEPQADVNVLFKKYAAELGLDSTKMDSAFAENRFREMIERDNKDGQSLGVRQTPTFFINGRKLPQLNEQALRFLVEDELKK